MPRRAAAQIRPVEPDPIHRSKLVQQVINKVMLDGKKSTAERIVYDALALIGERSDKDPLETLEASIRTLTPTLEVRSRRVGGATYQVPVEVPARRARTLAVRWLVEFARQRREKTMAQRLANELLDAHLPAGRRLQAQGRHLPHGAGEQGVRALPLVDAATTICAARAAGLGVATRVTSSATRRSSVAGSRPGPMRAGAGVARARSSAGPRRRPRRRRPPMRVA